MRVLASILFACLLAASARAATGQGLGVFTSSYPIAVEVLVDGRASSEPRLVAAYYTLKEFALSTPSTVDGWAYQATVRAHAREWCHAVVFAATRKEHRTALALLEARAKAASSYLGQDNKTGVAPIRRK